MKLPAAELVDGFEAWQHFAPPNLTPNPSPEGEGLLLRYWQAPQASGFSSEQAIASTGA
jgi:hypothetical protein